MFYKEINEEHIPTLARIYVTTYNAPPWNDEWTIELATLKVNELINSRDSFGIICYEDELEIIGMIIGNSEIFYNCKQFFIKDFLVVPSKQGNGIGTSLITEFEKRLKRMGISKTYLFTSRTDKTEKYYQKRGYKTWEELVVMGKRLCE